MVGKQIDLAGGSAKDPIRDVAAIWDRGKTMTMTKKKGIC